ncbi:tRNA1(Val) (adenine(37)-N6)-methyltransferase [Algoriphagus algorifonticola]|uniref:tRNA1(Val) (adenine(37)-N6)-methyltransferase n=1 Tax=Algoriphagus algorifonticola TaxID=2593007 RepID=UPI0011A0FBA0|nr:methyltransferase [Algoriphagus algorifonticola]
MGNSWFQFQQFRVEQDRCAMKISTDAVLLGSLAEGEEVKTILDIGTGTGVISLMLAQRFEQAHISAIEIDQDAFEQAKMNFEQSIFSDRLEISKGAIQDLKKKSSFDLIVSNPPYFPDHLKSTDSKRNQALHTDSLSFEDLANSVDQLLTKDGAFWVILPPRQMEELELIFSKLGFNSGQEIQVQDRPIKPIHRIVRSFHRTFQEKRQTRIFIKEDSGDYSDIYKSLISGFLLGF